MHADAPLSSIQSSLISSKVLPTHNFTDAVHEVMGRDVMGFDWQTPDGDMRSLDTLRFQGKFNLLCNSTIYTRLSHTPVGYLRTAAMLSDGLDDITITTTHSRTGGCIVRHGRHEIVLPSGGVLVTGKTRAHEVIIPWDASTYTMQVPRALIARLMPRLEEAPLRVFTPGSPGAASVELAMSYAALIARQGTLDGAPLASAVGHLHQLVASAIDTRWATTLPPDHAAAASARLALIQRSIRANLGDPGLGLDAVARLCGTSPRVVQRLFASQGGSFSDYLTEARLERARDLLVNPQDPRLVLEVALECGFNSFPAFSRAFRRRFGMTPSEARGAPPATAEK